MPRPSPDPLDRIIAANIRRHRLARGLTQQALAAAIGVSFQQVQKYESGRNRIAASRLVRIGLALRVPLERFLCHDDVHALEPTNDKGFMDFRA